MKNITDNLAQLQNNIQAYVKNFDWRSLRVLTNPRAADNLNAFLEKIPQNTGNTILIIASVAWAGAATLGLLTAVNLQKMSIAAIELEEAEALKPIVPSVKTSAVNANKIAEFVKSADEIYTGLSIKASGAKVTITAENLTAYGQFREAMSYLYNGGRNWQISINELCVGRECKLKPLTATLTVNVVSVSGS